MSTSGWGGAILPTPGVNGQGSGKSLLPQRQVRKEVLPCHGFVAMVSVKPGRMISA